MEPVLLATDGSPSAEAATGAAIDLAGSLELPLVVVSVAHVTVPAYGYFGYAEIVSDTKKIEHERIAHVLAAVKERATAAGVAV
jgi:nucleotide-binding universal stress UspA family protein